MLHASTNIYLQITTSLYSPRAHMVTGLITIQDSAVSSLLNLLTAMAAIKRCSAIAVYSVHTWKTDKRYTGCRSAAYHNGILC